MNRRIQRKNYQKTAFKIIILDYESEQPIENVIFDINNSVSLKSDEKGEASVQNVSDSFELKIKVTGKDAKWTK